jgi:hypothetical protein
MSYDCLSRTLALGYKGAVSIWRFSTGGKKLTLLDRVDLSRQGLASANVNTIEFVSRSGLRLIIGGDFGRL